MSSTVHSRWGRALIVLVAWAAGAGVVWAEAAPQPACNYPATVRPAGPAVVPANLPAFAFRGAEYSGIAQRPVEWYQIELRPAGGAALAVTIEAGEGGTYLVRPQQELPAGELVFSYLDDCPPYALPSRLVTPMRNDRTTFQVAPASALPAELGLATLRSVTYPPAFICGPRTSASVVVDVEPSAEALAFAPALTLDARAASSPYLQERVEFDEARRVFRINLSGRCDLGPGQMMLGRGVNTLEIHAVLLGSTATIAPARLSIDLECEAGADGGAGACVDASIPAEAPDSGRWDARLDASPAGQPAPAGGCGCRSGGGGPAAADLFWAGLLAGGLARACRRRRRRPAT